MIDILEVAKSEYYRDLKIKGYEDGYLKVDRWFIEIGEHPNHEMPLDSALEFVDFYGYKELINWESGKRGFVAKCAFHSIGKALENGSIGKK